MHRSWIVWSTALAASLLSCTAAQKCHADPVVFQLYDDFNDNSIDSNKWNTSGPLIEETNGRLRLWADTSHAMGNSPVANTENKTSAIPPGEPIRGVEYYFDWEFGGPEGFDRWVRITDGTNMIEIKSEHAHLASGNEITRILSTGNYAPINVGLSGVHDGTIRIVEQGNDIDIYFNNVFQVQIPNDTIRPNSYFEVYAQSISGTENYIEIDDLKFAVPEPSSITLVILGAYVLFVWSWRRPKTTG